jgi:hypothetical protein
MLIRLVDPLQGSVRAWQSWARAAGSCRRGRLKHLSVMTSPSQCDPSTLLPSSFCAALAADYHPMNKEVKTVLPQRPAVAVRLSRPHQTSCSSCTRPCFASTMTTAPFGQTLWLLACCQSSTHSLILVNRRCGREDFRWRLLHTTRQQRRRCQRFEQLNRRPALPAVPGA